MYAPFVEEYTITPPNKNLKENEEMSVKLVTERGAKDIKLRHVTLGDYVETTVRVSGKVIGIDYSDDMLMVLDSTDCMDVRAKDTIGSRVVVLEDYENRTDWMWVDIVDVKQHKIKTPPITVQVSVQPTVQEVKQSKPKRTSIKRIIEQDSLGNPFEYIIINKSTVFCVNKTNGVVGEAYLHSDDKFNLEIGKAISHYRATHRDKYIHE